MILLMQLIESAGPEAYELGEAMARATLSDGRIMLAAFPTGRMNKGSRKSRDDSHPFTVNLSNSNRNIAEQQGVSVGPNYT